MNHRSFGHPLPTSLGSITLARVAKERAITKLELIPTTVSGKRGWVTAKWTRTDGSKGEVIVWPRYKAAERFYIASMQMLQPTTAGLRDVPLARIEDACNANAEIRALAAK